MRKTSLLLILTALIILPSFALSAGGDDSWDRLSRVPSGCRLEVHDLKGRVYSGRFESFDDARITLNIDGKILPIPRETVLRVVELRKFRRLNNAMLGLAIGLGAGVGTGYALNAAGSRANDLDCRLFTIPVGAGVGALVGALLHAGNRTLYQAPAADLPPKR